MDKITRGIQKTPIKPGDTIVLAVSGGADSMAMLYGMMLQRVYPLVVVHIHHGIRGEEADRDAEMVASWCASNEVDCRVYRICIPEIAARDKIGWEECGRRERYRLLEQTANEVGAAWIATAHTLSDQVETVLLNMTRGTGPAGLCGIPSVRGRIIRPMLECTREDVKAFCRANRIPYIEDSSNQDNTYSRNRVRNQAIPPLKSLNPQLEKAVLRMTRLVREEHEFVVQTAAQLCEAVKRSDGWDAMALYNAPPAVRDQALVQICASHGIVRDLSEKHISLLAHILRYGGEATLPGAIWAICEHGVLMFSPDETRGVSAPMRLVVPSDAFEWDQRRFQFSLVSNENHENEQKIYKISLSDTLDYDTISKSGHLYLRSRREGDSFHQAGRGLKKAIKKLFNEAKIPVRQRDHVAILESDGRIAWVEGFGAAEWAKARPGEPAIRIKMEEL